MKKIDKLLLGYFTGSSNIISLQYKTDIICIFLSNDGENYLDRWVPFISCFDNDIDIELGLGGDRSMARCKIIGMDFI